MEYTNTSVRTKYGMALEEGQLLEKVSEEMTEGRTQNTSKNGAPTSWVGNIKNGTISHKIFLEVLCAVSHEMGELLFNDRKDVALLTIEINIKF
ncbi:MAG: hypothetical protein EXR35_01575 [Limnohabitans sp.]|nr:hypothetical protein [Limnohabitans sp.]